VTQYHLKISTKFVFFNTIFPAWDFLQSKKLSKIPAYIKMSLHLRIHCKCKFTGIFSHIELTFAFSLHFIACFFYNRGGQSAARLPHAALQRFSAAPVSNYGCTSKLFMMHLCIKYPKFTSVIWSLCKKKKP
jgi:hypothetical protein